MVLWRSPTTPRESAICSGGNSVCLLDAGLSIEQAQNKRKICAEQAQDTWFTLLCINNSVILGNIIEINGISLRSHRMVLGCRLAC